MTVVALGSIAGSPGVTRVAVGLAAAWPQRGRRIVVEADADGGRLGAELGVGVEPGLIAVALASRSGPVSADDVVVAGAAAVGSWFVVPAPPSAEQASSVLTHASAALAEAMGASRDEVWLVDTGRLSTRSPALPFARVADRTVLLTSGSFPALQLVPARVEALLRAGCRVGVVVVEPTSWSAAEVAGFVGADVLAVLPRVRHGHRDAIGAMSGNSWRGWWGHVERLAAVLATPSADAVDATAEAPPVPWPNATPAHFGPRWPG